MSKVITSILTHIEYEAEFFEQSISDEQKAKVVLNNLLNVVQTFDEDGWIMLFDKIGVYDTLGKANNIKAYKNATVDMLTILAKQHGWQFAEDGSSIYIYDEEYWIKVDTDVIKYFLGSFAKKLGVPVWLGIDAPFINDMYKQLQTAGFFEKMQTPFVTLLNLNNGTLKIDLNGVGLQKFDPRHFMTHQLDFEYDPEVKNQLWLEFLDDVLPDKDTQKTLQQSLGYLLTRDLKLEKAIFLYGTGSNGKSVIFEVLHGLLSSDMFTNYSLDSLTDTKGYHRANLNNKLINYGTDISMKKIDHGLFKQLVSGEPIEARPIYQDPFIMKNYAKLIFNLNKIDDADVESTIGFFRRMVFIPFEKTITKEKQDKNLHKKILANKAGVLNWLLEGVREVQQNEEIFVSKRCDNFLERFRKDSNLAIRFVEDKELVSSTGGIIGFQVLYQCFKEFCNDQGEKALTQKSFNDELRKLAFHSVRRSQGNVWFATFK